MADTSQALIILNIVLTAVSPLIVSLAYCMRKVRKSSCMGNSIEMGADSPPTTQKDV